MVAQCPVKATVVGSNPTGRAIPHLVNAEDLCTTDNKGDTTYTIDTVGPEAKLSTTLL